MGKVIEARLPGPGDRIDEYTVMSKGVELDYSDVPVTLGFDCGRTPIGKVLDIRREGDLILLTAELDGIEIKPAFIVRETEMDGDMRIIKAADLTHVSIGFRHYGFPKKLTLLERFKNWLKELR